MKKVAFITGAGGYLGSECARTLAKSGIAIAVCDINEATLNATVESIKALGGVAFGRVLDVTDSKDVDAAVAETVEKFGRLDMMVHAPRYESNSRLSDHALSSARTTHKMIIPTNQKIHSRHDCGPPHESSGPDGILKPLSNSSLNFSHRVIITFYHKI